MKYNKIKIEYIESKPKIIEDGILYISKKFSTTFHNCPCGCGEVVVIPITISFADGWELFIENDHVSLHPSLLQRFACKSHYYIRKGKIVWC